LVTLDIIVGELLAQDILRKGNSSIAVLMHLVDRLLPQIPVGFIKVQIRRNADDFFSQEKH
jgi:hypothetical protein